MELIGKIMFQLKDKVIVYILDFLCNNFKE